jgi:hypothetical protein
MTENMFSSPIEALVAGYSYDELFAPGKPDKYVVAALKWSTTVPGISILTKPFYEGANLLWGKGPDEGLVQLARVIIVELRFRDRLFEEFKRDMQRFEKFMAEVRGSLLLRQALGATQRTADQTKIERIGRILLNGALQWPQTNEERELSQQRLAEFMRIAEILTDTDVLVLRAIYKVQSPLISQYREIVGTNPSLAATTEASWIQAVFQTWGDTQFLAEGQPLSFFNVHSALIRLESQGLIGSTTSQTVVAQVTTTPYGLLELGAMFVESAVRQIQEEQNHDLA